MAIDWRQQTYYVIIINWRRLIDKNKPEQTDNKLKSVRTKRFEINKMEFLLECFTR